MPSLAPVWQRPVFWLILLLSGYGILGALLTGAGAGGSDSSGYLNQAKALATGQLWLPARTIPGLPPSDNLAFFYSQLGTRPDTDPERLVLTYPIGLPLLLAAGRALVGWDHVANIVALIHLLGGVALLYALLRTLDFDPWWSLAGMVVLGASPVYLFMGTQTMSDVPATVWCLAAMLAAWRSRERPLWAVAAGAAYGIAVLIRPTDILLILPLAVVLGLSWRRWLGFGMGGLPFAAIQLWYNHAAYGSWSSNGYGDARTLMGWGYAPATLRHYLVYVPLLFTPLALLAAALPWLGRRHPARALALALWILAFFGFYTFYQFTADTWWYLRFVLPAVPALIAAGLWCARALCSRHRRLHTIGIAGLLLAVGYGTYFGYTHWAYSSRRAQATYDDSARWASTNLPNDAIIACMQVSGALRYHTDFVLVRWDCFFPPQRSRIRSVIAASGRPFYAILFPFEHPDALERLGGRWTQVDAFHGLTIWRAADDGASPYVPPAPAP